MNDLFRQERGQSTGEYALIVVGLAITAALALGLMGGGTSAGLGGLDAALKTDQSALTSLGKGMPTISGNLIALTMAYHKKTGKWPRSWGDYAYTDLGLDPAEWKTPYDGIIYKPGGSRLMIAPADGYAFEVKGQDGKTYTLKSSYNWNLMYDMERGVWRYHTLDGPVIDISSLKVIAPK